MFFGAPGPAEALVLLSLFGGFGLPLGIPPAAEDPLMYKVAPEECLFYTTWAGMAAPDPNSANQTEQLLAEPEVQHLIGELERRVREGIRTMAEENEGPEAAALAEQLIGWGKTALTSPAAIFVEDVKINPGGPPEIRAGALVRVGEQGPAIKAKLVEYQTAFLRDAVTPVEIAGDTWYRIQPPEPGAPSITWGVRFSYFIVGIGDGSAEGIMQRARTEMPEWLSRVREQIPVPRTSTLTYINLAKIIEMARPFAGPRGEAIIEALGLGNVTALSSVTGLDGEGFVSRVLLGIEGEPAGIFELVSDKPLTPEDLAAIPADSTVALAARIDGDAIFETILSVAEKIEPQARQQAEMGLGQMQQALGIDLRADVLKPLGDTWCIYNSPSEGGLVITGLTAVVSLRDAERFAATHEKLLAMAQGMLSQQRGPRGGPEIREVEFAGRTIYVFDAGEEEFPLAPSWCLTDGELVAAPFPQNVKAFLSRGMQHRSLAEVPQVAAMFEEGTGPVVLTYYDTKALFELFYPMVPMMGQAISTQLKRGGIDFDVSLIPSAGAIGRHLLPGVGAVRRTPAGIEMTSRQTLPGGGMLAPASMMAFVGLPWIMVGMRREADWSVDRPVGMVVVYEVDKDMAPPGFEPSAAQMDTLVECVDRRLILGGRRLGRARQRDDGRIEVSIYDDDPEEMARIARVVATEGTLEFRILANPHDHGRLIQRAQTEEGRYLKDDEGNVLAWWVPVPSDKEANFESDMAQKEIAWRRQGEGDRKALEILVVKDQFDVTGKYLRRAQRDFDPNSGDPCISFLLNSTGGVLFQELTRANLPDEAQGITRKLGIILNGYLHAAPVLRSAIGQRGQITGLDDEREVRDLVLVLNAGSLPVAIRRVEESEVRGEPTRGGDF